MRRLTGLFVLAVGVAGLLGRANAAGLDPALQAKVDSLVPAIKSWAADPVVVQAVKAVNTNGPGPEYAAMTQEKWTGLTVLDPLVRAFTKNQAAQFLKSKQTAEVSEGFVSAASGVKVAFLSKTTYWSHKGKPKHDLPMSGRIWQGPLEVDEATGVQQVQVAVPILDGGKPIGSLVIGLAVSKLR